MLKSELEEKFKKLKKKNKNLRLELEEEKRKTKNGNCSNCFYKSEYNKPPESLANRDWM